MKKGQTTYDKIMAHLYKDEHEVKNILSPKEIEIKRRCMLGVDRLLENPSMSDNEMVRYIECGFGGVVNPVSKTQAYRDLGLIMRIVGNIQPTSKEWYRHMVIEMCKKAYAIAEQNNDAKGMAAAADKIGKYTKCDKDEEKMNFDEMLPPSFEPSDDVTLLGDGFEAMANLEEERRKFRALFKKETSQATVVEEEVEDAQ